MIADCEWFRVMLAEVAEVRHRVSDLGASEARQHKNESDPDKACGHFPPYEIDEHTAQTRSAPEVKNPFRTPDFSAGNPILEGALRFCVARRAALP
jgi:hypothetical protein